MDKKSIVFMGTPKIAADVLQALLDAGISIDLVVTQPDKKVGRKQTIVYSPVKELALQHNIEVFQPFRIKEDYQRILDVNPDLVVTCAYGQIVPDQVLEAPKYGCVNLHGSLLPKYRGGAPIQRAIWNGEEKTGMSLMKMVSQMDAGPVFAQKETEITNQDTSTTIFERLGRIAGELIVENLEALCQENAQYKEQDPQLVTYAPIITKEEERIDLTKDDTTIFNQIRALAQTPGGYVMLHGKKWKIIDASYQPKSIAMPMEVLGWVNEGYGIALHQGVLVVHQCQMEGKPAMDAKSFFNGQGRNFVKESIE